jgi:hypothetical protein
VSIAETRFSLKRDLASIEQVLVQALVAVGWKSSLMSRNKITTQALSNTVTAGGDTYVGSFSAIVTWEEKPNGIDVLVVVSERASNAPALSATCSDLCNAVVAAIPDNCVLSPGKNSSG